MSISSDEVNYLVYRYLLESGFSHAAFTFAHESLVARTVVADAEVPPGALVTFLQKGLQYVEIESHLQEDGTERQCDEPFHLLAPHVCRLKAAPAAAGAALASSSSTSSGRGAAAGGASSQWALTVPPSQVAVLPGHSNEVFTCAFNPRHEGVLATGSADGTARVWAEAGDAAGAASSSGGALGCRSVLAHASDAGAASAPGSQNVTSVDWSPDGERLATGCHDGRARIWNGSDGSLAAVLSGHAGPIFSLQWSPSGNALLTGSVDKTAMVWDAASGTATRSFAFHSAAVLDVEWQSDDAFASCSSDKTIVLCSLAEKGPVRTWSGHADEVNSLHWNPAKDLLASGSDDGTVRLWSPSSPAASNAERTAAAEAVLVGHRASVYSVKWAPCGPGSPSPSKSSTLASASFDSTVKLWDPETSRARLTLAKHTALVYAIAWSPDGDLIASGASDNTVHLWSARDGSLVRSLPTSGGVFDLQFSASGNRLAVATADAGVTVVDLRAIR